MTEIYRLMYKDNEIQLKEGTCLQPWKCECYNTDSARCGYTVKEAKQKIVEYYKKRAEDVDKLSDEDFLKEHGIYI